MRRRYAIIFGTVAALSAAIVPRRPPPRRRKQGKSRQRPDQMLAWRSRWPPSGAAIPAQGEQILELLARDPSPEVRSEARFRQALLLEGRGEDRAAAVSLRRILDDKPDTAPVRLKLATMLQKMGDEFAALRELRALGTSDLPPNVARFVDRLSASLQASKPLGFQLEVALAPDCNINRATRSDTLDTVFGDFMLDKRSKARSGVGAALRGFAQARHSFSDALGRGGEGKRRGQPLSREGVQLHFARFRRGAGNARRSHPPGPKRGITQQWYGMQPYHSSLRVAGIVTHPLDTVSQLRLDAGARWADNRFNDLQDGRGLSVRARYERALSPSLFLAAHFGIDRFKASDDAYSTRSWNAGLAAYQEFGRMTLSAGIDLGGLKADDRLSLLPAAREDKLLRLSVGSVFRQLTVAGFAPMTRLLRSSATRATSNSTIISGSVPSSASAARSDAAPAVRRSSGRGRLPARRRRSAAWPLPPSRAPGRIPGR